MTELVIGPAAIEFFYKMPRVRLRDLPSLQALKLEQVTGRKFLPPEAKRHAQSVALTLVEVAEHVMNVWKMREAYTLFGAARDAASAKKRLEFFIEWSTENPGTGGQCLVAVAMHEALTFNTHAATAFGAELKSPKFKYVLNGAWDLYQLGHLLHAESDRQQTGEMSLATYVTCDKRLASIFENYGVVNVTHGVVGVTPVTLIKHPELCEISSGAVKMVRVMPDIHRLREDLRLLDEIFAPFAEKYNDKDLKVFHYRILEARVLLSSHTETLFKAR